MQLLPTMRVFSRIVPKFILVGNLLAVSSSSSTSFASPSPYIDGSYSDGQPSWSLIIPANLDYRPIIKASRLILPVAPNNVYMTFTQARTYINGIYQGLFSTYANYIPGNFQANLTGQEFSVEFGAEVTGGDNREVSANLVVSNLITVSSTVSKARSAHKLSNTVYYTAASSSVISSVVSSSSSPVSSSSSSSSASVSSSARSSVASISSSMSSSSSSNIDSLSSSVGPSSAATSAYHLHQCLYRHFRSLRASRR